MCGEEYLCDKFDFKKGSFHPFAKQKVDSFFLHRRKDDIPEAETTFS